MAIIRPGSFTFPRQWNPAAVPNFPAELDTTNALSTGLGDFAVFATGQNYAAPGFAPYNVGSVPFKAAARGAAPSTPGTLTDYAALPLRTNLATPLFTVSLLFQPISVSGAYAVIWDKGTGISSREMSLFVDTSLNFDYCTVGGYNAPLAITSGMSFGGVYEVTMTRDGANLVTIYVNGASVGTATASGGTAQSVQTAFGANITTGGANTAANFFRWATWQGVCLTANQVAELATEPFAMLRPVVRRSYFVAAATGFAIQGDYGMSMAWSASIRCDEPVPVASASAIRADQTAPLSQAANTRVDGPQPAAWGAAVRSDATAPVGYAASLRNDQTAPLGNLSAIREDISGPLAWAASSRSDSAGAVSWGASVRLDTSSYVAWANSIRGDAPSPLAWGSSIRGDEFQPMSWGTSLRQDQNAPLAWGGSALTIQGDSMMPISWAAAAIPMSGAGFIFTRPPAPTDPPPQPVPNPIFTGFIFRR